MPDLLEDVAQQVRLLRAGGATGALLAANNLSDLVTVATARTNLGLGDIAIISENGNANTWLDGTGAWTNPTTVAGALRANTYNKILGPTSLYADDDPTPGPVAEWRLVRSHGDATTPTPALSGDALGILSFAGQATVSSQNASVSLTGYATENYSLTAGGSRLILQTTPNGRVARSTALYIDQDQSIYAAGGVDPASLPTSASLVYAQRAANIAISKRGTATITEVLLADSFDSTGPSSAESTSFAAIYERTAWHYWNPASERGAAFMNVNIKAADDTTDTGVKWDTVGGTWVQRGFSFSSRSLASGQSCVVTRGGDAVTVYYTASRATAGTLSVDINGTVAGTINTLDATVPAAPGYDSGRSVTYTNPNGYGSMAVTVSCTAGTSQLDACYFHNQNATKGYRLLRFTRPGWRMNGLVTDTRGHLYGATSGGRWVDGTNPDALQAIKNIQPQIVTIVLGVNDANQGSGGSAQTASAFATNITNMLAAVRAQFLTRTVTDGVTTSASATVTSATAAFVTADIGAEICNANLPVGTRISSINSATSVQVSNNATASGTGQTLGIAPRPAIRYVFQWENNVSPVNGVDPQDWLTDYRKAAREVIRADGDALWLDMSDALGSVRTTSDAQALTSDHIHPGDAASYTLGMLLANATIPAYPIPDRALRLDGTSANSQRSTAVGGDIKVYQDNDAPILHLIRDGGTSATLLSSGDTIAALNFGGRKASADYVTAVQMRARADAAWTSTSTPSRWELQTILTGNISPGVRLIVDNAGKLWGGATVGAALWSIDQAGVATFVSVSCPGIWDLSQTASNTVNKVSAGVVLSARIYAGALPLRLERVNGTPAVPTVIVNNDVLGGLSLSGAAAVSGTVATIYVGAQIAATATENWSGTAGGSKLEFNVTANTTQTLTTALTIANTGIATFAFAAKVLGALDVGSAAQLTISAAGALSTSGAIAGTSTLAIGSTGQMTVGAAGAIVTTAGVTCVNLTATGTTSLGSAAQCVISTAGALTTSGAISGTSTLAIGSTGQMTVGAAGAIGTSASIKSSSATGGVGYSTGAGGTVTQLTSKSTGVTLNTACGAITMHNANLATGTTVSFVLTNSAIAATDTLVLNHISGGTLGPYIFNAACAAGSATIYVRNVSGGTLGEALVLQFAVVKAVNA